MRFWSVWILVACVVELSAMARLLAGGQDHTFSAWTRQAVPAWLVAALAGWFVVHTAGPYQDTRASLLTTLAAVLAAWLAMRAIQG